MKKTSILEIWELKGTASNAPLKTKEIELKCNLSQRVSFFHIPTKEK
jgi:hypothetical protein